MERKIIYKRKLSSEEANGRYVMVLLDSLKLFPKPDVIFQVEVKDETFDSKISIVNCWCRGPQKPHVHYRIDLTPFIKTFRPHFGQTVTFELVKDSVYKLS